MTLLFNFLPRSLSRFPLRALFLAGTLALAGVAFSACKAVAPPNSLATHNPARWEKEIVAMEASDATNLPPQGGIVFVGSSSIRLWRSLSTDFPGLPVINRGFGGSQLADAVYYADRIVTPYHPRQVVVYAGANDIAAGKSPEVVYGDFVALTGKLRSALPRARLSVIAIAGNPSRWSQVEKVKLTNALMASYCRRHQIDYIDVFSPMMQADGTPRPDIFVSDRLHMNEKGYAIWRDAVAPYLR